MRADKFGTDNINASLVDPWWTGLRRLEALPQSSALGFPSQGQHFPVQGQSPVQTQVEFPPRNLSPTSTSKIFDPDREALEPTASQKGEASAVAPVVNRVPSIPPQQPVEATVLGEPGAAAPRRRLAMGGGHLQLEWSASTEIQSEADALVVALGTGSGTKLTLFHAHMVLNMITAMNVTYSDEFSDYTMTSNITTVQVVNGYTTALTTQTCSKFYTTGVAAQTRSKWGRMILIPVVDLSTMMRM